MAARPVRWPGVTVDDTGWDWLASALEAAGTPGKDSALPSIASADHAGPAQLAVCVLDPDAGSAKTARDFVQATLRNWALDAPMDNVAIVVSELVTNALRHGLHHPAEPAPPGSIGMGILRQGSRILCAVADPGIAVPILTEPDYLAETGRGLHVVAALSDTWGWTSFDACGKVVWVMLSASHPSSCP